MKYGAEMRIPKKAKVGQLDPELPAASAVIPLTASFHAKLFVVGGTLTPIIPQSFLCNHENSRKIFTACQI